MSRMSLILYFFRYLAINFYLFSCDVYLVALLLLMYLTLYVCLYCFYLLLSCFMLCLSVCSSFTHVLDALCLSLFSYIFLSFCHGMFIFRSSLNLFFDTALLSLCSYVFLPFCQVMGMVLLFFYSIP